MIADQRQGDVAEGEVGPDHGDQRHRSHRSELCPGTDSPDVVRDADDGDRPGADQDRRIRALEVEEEEGRDDDPEHDRDPADAGDRARVDARAVVAVVESADPRSQPSDQRSQHEHDGGRAYEAPEERFVACQRVHGIRERHARGYTAPEGPLRRHGARRATIRSLAQVLRQTAVFEDRIATREATLGVVGLGYAGLPLAVAQAQAGFDVVGIDLNEARVQAVSERRSYLIDVPAQRYDELDGRLRATSDYSAVAELDAVTICVPTPLSKTRTPDISHVISAAEALAENLRPDQLVVLQSTTYPGTTEEIVLPILERTGNRRGGLLSRLRP